MTITFGLLWVVTAHAAVGDADGDGIPDADEAALPVRVFGELGILDTEPHGW